VIYLPPCVDPASRHSLYSVRSGSLAEQVEPGPRLTPVTDTRGHETMHMRPQRAAAMGHIPRPLWPSTSTKNPAYPDTRNVDSMFGLDTVTTLPEATIAVFETRAGWPGPSTSMLRRPRTRCDDSAVGVDIDDVGLALETERVW